MCYLSYICWAYFDQKQYERQKLIMHYSDNRANYYSNQDTKYEWGNEGVVSGVLFCVCLSSPNTAFRSILFRFVYMFQFFSGPRTSQGGGYWNVVLTNESCTTRTYSCNTNNSTKMATLLVPSYSDSWLNRHSYMFWECKVMCEINIRTYQLVEPALFLLQQKVIHIHYCGDNVPYTP